MLCNAVQCQEEDPLFHMEEGSKDLLGPISLEGERHAAGQAQEEETYGESLVASWEMTTPVMGKEELGSQKGLK
ncbi:hypothetical protein JD844_013974, partial [Phrynosoma platyrhinos]